MKNATYCNMLMIRQVCLPNLSAMKALFAQITKSKSLKRQKTIRLIPSLISKLSSASSVKKTKGLKTKLAVRKNLMKMMRLKKKTVQSQMKMMKVSLKSAVAVEVAAGDAESTARNNLSHKTRRQKKRTCLMMIQTPKKSLSEAVGDAVRLQTNLSRLMKR